MQPTLHVFTYKDGLLARLAHDLRLTLQRFDIRLEAGAVEGRFDLGSFRVDGVMEKGGRLDGSRPSERDKSQILKHVAEDILHSDRYPEARFEGRLAGELSKPKLSGELTLRGRPLPVSPSVEPGEVVRVRARLTPSEWGIAPYKALGGAIRLQDRVDVELWLPPDVPGLQGQDWTGAHCHWQARPEG